MVWSATDLSSTVRGLADNDKPLILAENLLYSLSQGRWNTTGSFATADATHTDGPVYLAYDAFSHRKTKPNSSQAEWHLILDFGALVTFDSIAILQHNFGTATTPTITLRVADGSTFSGAQSIASWSPTSGSTKRLVGLVLKDTGSVARAITSQYVGIKIEAGASFTPQIGEIILGSRRQLKHQPDVPWDDSDRQSFVDRFTSSNKISTTYVQASGQRHISAQLSTYETAYQDDLDEFYSDDTANGVRPFLWIDNPNSNPQGAPWMLLTDPKFSNPWQGPSERIMNLVADEQGGQFVSEEV